MSDKRDEIVEFLALAEIALEVGDRAQAGRYLTQALELDPAHSRARDMLQVVQPGEPIPLPSQPPPPEAVPPAAPEEPQPEEDLLGAMFLTKCPVCRTGKLHWPRITTTTVRESEILCTNCASVLVPSGTQSSVGQFLFRFSSVDPRYAHDSVDIWARSFTRQELADIAVRGKPRGPSKAGLYVALSLGDFSALRPVDTQHVRTPMTAGEQAYFLVDGVTYAQPSSLESDSIEEIMERVAQGISIIPLGFQTRPKMMELQICDTGSLLVTSQRYIFEGRKGQQVGSLHLIRSVETYLDGVGVERSDGTPADYFLGISADQAALTSAVFRGALKNVFTEEEQ